MLVIAGFENHIRILGRMDLSWKQARHLAANKAIDELRAFYNEAVTLEIPSHLRELNSALGHLDSFILNLEALAAAPMEPEKGVRGYEGYDVVRGVEKDADGIFHTNYKRVALVGDNINLGRLSAAVNSLREHAETRYDRKLPDLDKFEKILDIKIVQAKEVTAR